MAAWIVGWLILCGAGWSGGAVLAAFFVSSSLVSRTVASATAATLDPKGDRRDAWQVSANGGPAALLALIGPAEAGWRTWLVAASLAAAAADTWATSFGARSPKPPRLFWFGRTVAPGTSGGITALGNLGALAGAAVVAGTAALTTGPVFLFWPATLIGFGGMLLDSLLGATLQAGFWCTRCELPSEWRVHRCGGRTVLKSGWSWMNNDVVNLFTTAAAGTVAWAVWSWLD